MFGRFRFILALPFDLRCENMFEDLSLDSRSLHTLNGAGIQGKNCIRSQAIQKREFRLSLLAMQWKIRNFFQAGENQCKALCLLHSFFL